jgi:predicted dehydrogenase
MLNFAIIGCGRISKKHVELLGNNAVKNAQLAAVCDIDIKKAKEYGDKFGVPFFTDIDEITK